jgi:LysM repeat protein
MVLYYLWPQAETRPAKKTEQVVKKQNRELPELVQVDKTVIEEPLQMAAPEEPVQEVMAVEDSQEPEIDSDEIPEEQPESFSSEVSKEIDGPHATIEREGDMVTITLRESELSDEMTTLEESHTIELVTETETDTLVNLETIALKEEVQVADPQGQAREPEEDGSKQQMSSSSKESLEDVIVLRSSSEELQSSAPVTAREIIHVVVRGDTLWHIARRYIHDPFRYPELARLSNIKNPDLIYPGDRVRILIIRH